MSDLSRFRNPLKQRLAEGKLSVGFGLRQARTTDTAVIAKALGFHWLFVDTEHTSLTMEAVAQLAPAAISETSWVICAWRALFRESVSSCTISLALSEALRMDTMRAECSEARLSRIAW